MLDEAVREADAAAAEAPPYVRFSAPLAAEIVARVAGGESVAAVCREAGMPHRGTVAGWAEAHPEFEAALADAREAARVAGRRRDLALAGRTRDPRGLWCTYTRAVGRAICLRIAAGQTLPQICREPWAPHRTTVFNWARRVPEFADDYARARMIAVHRLCDEALEIGRATTPGTVKEDRARFRMICALTARIAPRKYLEPVRALRGVRNDTEGVSGSGGPAAPSQAA